MEPNLTIVLGLGLVLGMKHALDADHVAAVSTIVSKSGSLMKSSLVGLFWGLGHTATLFSVGLLLLLLKVSIPEKLALLAELAAGVMLVVLGLSLVRRLVRERLHCHFHSHGEGTHFHAHSHKDSVGHQHEHKSLIVGMVHGLAGSAAVLLLALSAVRSVLLGIIYILFFGLGTVIGMTILTSIISLPFIFTASRLKKVNELISALAGVTSIALGFFIIYQVGWVRALFF